jgi:hypothetical protein
VRFRVLAVVLIAATATPAAAEHVFCTQWRNGDAKERLRLAVKFARQTPEEVRQCVLEGLVEGAVDDWVENTCPNESEFVVGMVLGGVIWSEAYACGTTGKPTPRGEDEPAPSETPEAEAPAE